MRKLLTIIFIISCSYCFGQPIINRASSNNTVQDGRWSGLYNAFMPRYADTTAANVQKGIDSCSAVIFTYDVNGLWYRQCSPKKWVRIGGGAYTFTNGLTESPAGTVKLGGELTGNTTIAGATNTYDLMFNNIDAFQVNDATSVYLEGTAGIGFDTPEEIEMTVGTYIRAVGTFIVNEDTYWSGTLNAPQITSNQNDYNPTGSAAVSTIRISSDAARNITGLDIGQLTFNGKIIILQNVGSFNITLVNSSVLSTSTSRFAFAADIILQPNQAITLHYDNISFRWRTMAGVGGGGTVVGSSNWQQTLDVSSVLDKANTIDGGNFLFTFDNTAGVSFDDFIQVNTMYIGVGSSASNQDTYIGVVPPTNRNVLTSVLTLGWNTGKNLTTNSTNNLIIGNIAMFATTDGNTFNVAIGEENLRVATNADNNTSVGHRAGLNLATSQFNAMFGYEALGGGTSASFNSAFGYQAGKGSGAIGAVNSWFGYRAGTSITTGDQNSGFGANAQLALTTGIKNSAFGAGSLETNTTGRFNTAIGHDAMQSYNGASASTTDGYNVAVGWTALLNGGVQNVGIGVKAGSSVTVAGENNVFIGYNSGFSGSQLTTASNSIAIGAGTFTTASNQMVLGQTTITETHIRGTVINFTGNATQASEIKLFEDTDNGTNYTSFKVGVQSADLPYTLPTAYPAVTGYVLSSTDAGVMSWVSNISTTPLSSITAATTSAGIDNGANDIVWAWNSLASGSAFSLISTSTATTSGSSIMFSIGISGANSTAEQSTYAQTISNSHTGTQSANYGLSVSATGGTFNYAIVVPSGGGSVGIGTLTPLAQLHTTSTVRFAGIGGAGTVESDADGDLSVTSDRRLKLIDAKYTIGLKQILQLTPIVFRKINKPNGVQYGGLDALQVYEVLKKDVGVKFAEAVAPTNKEGNHGLYDRAIMGMLINSIKEQQKQIEVLKKEVKLLKVKK